MATSPIYVARYPIQGYSFAAADSTNWRLLALSPSPNGCRVHYLNAAQTEGTARNLSIGIGRRLSSPTNFGATKTVTTQNTINRASGSFITDGWRVNDIVMLANNTDLFTDANHSAFGVVSSVSATALAVTGTPFTNQGPMSDSLHLYKVALQTMHNVPASAGNSNSVPSVAALGTTQWPMIDGSPGRFLTLGPNDILVGQLGTAMTTTSRTDVTVGLGDYT